MDDIRTRLADEDPLASEPLPDALVFDRMRRAVMGEGRESSRPEWRIAPERWVAATAAIALLALGAQLVREDEPRATPRAAPARPPAERTAESRTPSRRQVQFVTAGGTRIIWILNEELEEWNRP